MTARRAALTLALFLLPLSACGGADQPPASSASTSPTASPALSPGSSPAGSAAPAPAASAAVPSAAASPPAAKDGLEVVFGTLLADRYTGAGFGIGYDKVDYRPKSCKSDAGGLAEQEAAFKACWSNVNPKLRTARISERDEVTNLLAFYPFQEGERDRDEEVEFGADEIDIILQPAEGRRPNAVSVWRIVLQDGQVVELVEQPNRALSPTEAAEAARATSG